MYYEFQKSSLATRNQTFNFAILDNLKRVLGSAMTHDHKMTKPNQTKPNQGILGPLLGLFDPFLGQKSQKTTVTKLSEHSPSIYTYGQNIFWESGPWGNS